MQDRAHWLSLHLQLPSEGLAVRFPTEDACKERLVEVRWPYGPICSTCLKKNSSYIETRKLNFCRNCGAQFSLTSGTLLHGRQLDLRVYFSLAAQIIDRRARGSKPTGHGIKDEYGMAYATAVRLRDKITKDLLTEDGGLLGRCICTEKLELPLDVDAGSEGYLQWLLNEQQRRRWRSLGIE